MIEWEYENENKDSPFGQSANVSRQNVPPGFIPNTQVDATGSVCDFTRPDLVVFFREICFPDLQNNELNAQIFHAVFQVTNQGESRGHDYKQSDRKTEKQKDSRQEKGIHS